MGLAISRRDPRIDLEPSDGLDTELMALTSATLSTLERETSSMRVARDRGALVRKERTGLFRFTCGGQHLLLGSAYAVAHGFGPVGSKEAVCDQLDLMMWRVDVELEASDPLMAAADSAMVKAALASQKLRFLVHWLATVHTIAALDLCASDQRVRVDSHGG